MTQQLLLPLRLGSLDLKHRVVMASLTRMRAFIANPDLAERVRRGAGLNTYNRATVYGGGAEGYVDYPALQASNR